MAPRHGSPHRYQHGFTVAGRDWHFTLCAALRVHPRRYDHSRSEFSAIAPRWQPLERDADPGRQFRQGPLSNADGPWRLAAYGDSILHGRRNFTHAELELRPRARL